MALMVFGLRYRSGCRGSSAWLSVAFDWFSWLSVDHDIIMRIEPNSS